MRSLEQTLAVSTVLLVALANGCASQAPGNAQDVEAKRAEKRRAAAKQGDSPPPPPGPALPPVELDQEVVVSVGTTFVFSHSVPGSQSTYSMRVAAIQGASLAVHHSAGLDLVFKQPASEDGSVPPIEVVEVPAGKFRCYRTHAVIPASNFPPAWHAANGNGDVDQTTWTSVDFPVPVKTVAVWDRVDTNELIRIESATTRPRAGASPPGQPAAAPPAPAQPGAAPLNFCPSCGAKVTSGARFCGSCGAPLDGGPVEKKDEPKKNEF